MLPDYLKPKELILLNAFKIQNEKAEAESDVFVVPGHTTDN